MFFFCANSRAKNNIVFTKNNDFLGKTLPMRHQQKVFFCKINYFYFPQTEGNTKTLKKQLS